MNTIIRLMLVSMLMIVAAPAFSDIAAQVFVCEQDDAASDEAVEAMASEWLKAARGMKGGDQLKVYLRFPLAVQMGEKDFEFIIEAPSYEAWGMFWDGYQGSAAEAVDDKFDDLADCPDSSLWELVRVK